MLCLHIHWALSSPGEWLAAFLAGFLSQFNRWYPLYESRSTVKVRLVKQTVPTSTRNTTHSPLSSDSNIPFSRVCSEWVKTEIFHFPIIKRSTFILTGNDAIMFTTLDESDFIDCISCHKCCHGNAFTAEYWHLLNDIMVKDIFAAEHATLLLTSSVSH